MNFTAWLLIGRWSLEVWLALFPAEQAKRISLIAEGYCQEYQCHRASIMIETTDKNVSVYAKCSELEV